MVASSVLGVLARETGGSRVGQRLLFLEAMQFTDKSKVIHWGFGLGTNLDCTSRAIYVSALIFLQIIT